MSAVAGIGLRVVRGGRAILDDVDFEARAGELVGLLGPNGAGKSTLLRVLAGVLPAEGGRLTLRGRDPAGIDRQGRARELAYLPQAAECHWPLAVEEVVALGRLPHRGPWAPATGADREAVERALGYTDTLSLRRRRVDTLSGGERARVLLARALAGEPRVLLADEPVAGLDPAHQLEVMAVLDRLAGEGASVVVVLHDLTLAARHCHRLVLLDEGRLVASGSSEEVLSAENLGRSFHIRAHRGRSPEGPYVIPVARIDDQDGSSRG
jgi:iron complex transport system ATP-binding protein